MSAYIVDKAHIDALLTAGLAWGNPLTWHVHEEVAEGDLMREMPWDPTATANATRRRRELSIETADTVGTMLWAENVRSVNFRYDEAAEEAPGMYVFQRLPGTPDPLVILNAIQGYEYQACEHPGWTTSEAHEYCAALRRLAIRHLPGYEDAGGWHINERDVFQTHQNH